MTAADGGLFPEPDHTPTPDTAPPPAGADKRFRDYHPDQPVLLPGHLDEWVADDDLAVLIFQVVDDVLDLDDIYASYVSTKGQPPYDPRMMLKVLLLGYATGMRSSRAMEKACRLRIDFRLITGGEVPNFIAFNRFRKRHRTALESLFGQVLAVCKQLGMTSLATVALDGTKLTANASRHKAMSYSHMDDKLTANDAEIAAIETELAQFQDLAAEMFDEADAVDADEDDTLGAAPRRDLPADLVDQAVRRDKLQAANAKITRAKAQIERDAQDAARDKAQATARDRGDDDEQVTGAGDAAAEAATPSPKQQRSFTDPQARMMKTVGGAFDYCYNGQAVVDGDHQVIVGISVGTNPADSTQLLPMVTDVHERVGVPGQWLADAGYCSKKNLAAVDEIVSDCRAGGRDTEFFIALNSSNEVKKVPDKPVGRIPKDASQTYLMGRKLKTKRGRDAFAKRKYIVEPVFGQIQTRQGKQLLLRGEAGARVEWSLLTTCHNLLKIFTRRKDQFQQMCAALRPQPA